MAGERSSNVARLVRRPAAKTAAKAQPKAAPKEGGPPTYERLTNTITERHPSMSRRFQQIARFLVQSPNEVALESIKTIADNAGVHPSSLVRFAQSLGYGGFTAMQRVFQDRLVTAAPGFAERVAMLENELDRHSGTANMAFLRDLVIRDIAALQYLIHAVSEEQLARAVELLSRARQIYVLGQLRSYPVASFIRYALTMLGCEVILLDAAGGLATEQAKIMGPDCVLVAVSFRYYAREVVSIVEAAGKAGVPLIGISDNQLSPLAKHATVFFDVPEDEYAFSRSLAAPMCLAQTLIIGLANRMQPENRGKPVIPIVTRPQR
ncbi:MAG TPA: MurR/RpiR family transcriptional regulator [Magnetospirillaceae bacterium]|jgi:DNA-binding MurR/RpiR family transcriptional regulator